MAEPLDLEAVARRIRHLAKLADNDPENEQALAEYLADQALDLADALERIPELERDLAEARDYGKHMEEISDHYQNKARRAERVDAAARAASEFCIRYGWPEAMGGWAANERCGACRHCELRAVLAPASGEEAKG